MERILGQRSRRQGDLTAAHVMNEVTETVHIWDAGCTWQPPSNTMVI